MMRRWVLIAAMLICVVFVHALVSNVVAKREERKREAVFQETLRSYQEALKPGMTRKQVEDYLNSKDASFTRTCCIDQEGRFAADITKIWQGKPPWYCNDNSMYVAFQFTTPALAATSSDPKDVLDKVMLYQHLGGCL